MSDLKIVPPTPMFGPGADAFPDSDERPEGVISVKWDDDKVSDNLDVKSGIVYQSKDGEDQHIHLISPAGFAFPGMPAPKNPLIAYIPGSAFHRQSLWMALRKAVYFASRGYAFAIIEYRPTDIGAAYPAQRDDAIAAIKFLIANAEQFGIDAKKIAVWGDSSGGHTAVSVAAEVPEIIKCCVDWYGPTDLTTMSYYPSGMDHFGADTPEGMLIGGKPILENPDLAAQASPINHISAEKPFPPILIMHGTKDMLVPFNQSVRLYEKLKSLGKDAAFYRLEGGGHGSGGFVSDTAYEIAAEFIARKI